MTVSIYPMPLEPLSAAILRIRKNAERRRRPQRLPGVTDNYVQPRPFRVASGWKDRGYQASLCSSHDSKSAMRMARDAAGRGFQFVKLFPPTEGSDGMFRALVIRSPTAKAPRSTIHIACHGEGVRKALAAVRKMMGNMFASYAVTIEETPDAVTIDGFADDVMHASHTLFANAVPFSVTHYRR